MKLEREIDFQSEIYDYIVFVTGISAERVFRGSQTRSVLPADNEFCVYTPLFRNRRGTNIYSFNGAGVPDSENARETFTGAVNMDIQIDFYGVNASRFAQGVETAAKSDISNRYFAQKGIDLRVLTCDNPRDLTEIDASMQYVPRWAVILTIAFDSAISDGVPWFEDFNTTVKNVDVFFPPKD